VYSRSYKTLHLTEGQVAKTLVAVEDVLREQEINASATAYLVTLVSPFETSLLRALAFPSRFIRLAR
jgi:hypothetical protein